MPALRLLALVLGRRLGTRLQRFARGLALGRLLVELLLLFRALGARVALALGARLTVVRLERHRRPRLRSAHVPPSRERRAKSSSTLAISVCRRGSCASAVAA